MATLRSKLRCTKAYELWRYFRASQQVAAYHRLVDSYAAIGTPSTYSVEITRQKLRMKQAERQQLVDQNQPPVIMAFGTSDWEQYGLWQSFERISRFHLFDYDVVRKRLGGAPSPLMRETLAKEFLAYVDRVNSATGVQLCFFYADSAYISTQLLDMLAERGIWSVIMGLDDKHRLYVRRQYGMEIGNATIYSHCDLAWTTWKLGADIITSMGGTAWYAPSAADPHFYYPVDCEKDIEIVFVGQAYGIRYDLVRFLHRRGFQVEAFGSGWPNGFIGHEQMIQVFSRAKVVLGVGGVQNTDRLQHLKGRDFEVPMCGAVYLTTFNPELSDWFDVGKEILCYSSFENCAEVLGWALRRPDIQRLIRKSALQRSLRDHTWEIRLKNLLSLFP